MVRDWPRSGAGLRRVADEHHLARTTQCEIQHRIREVSPCMLNCRVEREGETGAGRWNPEWSWALATICSSSTCHGEEASAQHRRGLRLGSVGTPRAPTQELDSVRTAPSSDAGVARCFSEGCHTGLELNTTHEAQSTRHDIRHDTLDTAFVT